MTSPEKKPVKPKSWVGRNYRSDTIKDILTSMDKEHRWQALLLILRAMQERKERFAVAELVCIKCNWSTSTKPKEPWPECPVCGRKVYPPWYDPENERVAKESEIKEDDKV